MGKVSTGSEKVATGSESNPCRHLFTATGLLPESGCTRPSAVGNYKLFFFLLEENPILPMTPRDGCEVGTYCVLYTTLTTCAQFPPPTILFCTSLQVHCVNFTTLITSPRSMSCPSSPTLHCSTVYRCIVYITLPWLHCTLQYVSTGTLCTLHYPDYTTLYSTCLQVHCVHYTTVITGVSANCSVMETHYMPVQCHYMLLMSLQCSSCTALHCFMCTQHFSCKGNSPTNQNRQFKHDLNI